MSTAKKKYIKKHKKKQIINKKNKLFVAFPWVETSTGPGGFMICVFINMTGTPEGSTESGFMEKPGIEPATPGLQGIALIHYTNLEYRSSESNLGRLRESQVS